MNWTEGASTVVDGGRFVHRARLDGRRSQVAFGLLLDTLARPGEIRDLARVDLPAGLPTPLILHLALADVEVPLAVVTGDPDSPWPDLMVDATGASLTTPDAAAQVVMLDGFGPDDVLGLARGTTEAPENGARVAISCRQLHDLGPGVGPLPAGLPATAADADVVVALSGPGVDGWRVLGIDGLAPSLLLALADANRSYPAGIDCWFVTPTGEIAAVPRSSRIEVLGPASDDGKVI
ncbi:MAG: phosphonate C-P lyase system protein PhnH [Acidimicrobiales bacterium]